MLDTLCEVLRDAMRLNNPFRRFLVRKHIEGRPEVVGYVGYVSHRYGPCSGCGLFELHVHSDNCRLALAREAQAMHYDLGVYLKGAPHYQRPIWPLGEGDKVCPTRPDGACHSSCDHGPSARALWVDDPGRNLWRG